MEILRSHDPGQMQVVKINIEIYHVYSIQMYILGDPKNNETQE